ncbi:hypothetical protein JIG36_51045 [Actinoplanes sp. LDG1-06]|uniref:Uncharacterized protein n=1 Tax=Paractinoplanes ovalisporus TaxID=2810368 RepID=A0ABS2AVF6_9ACTN|nr:hypothetical protein [Actinoplanes ovalisporus]MBM2623857.1 hypothetical protein [Actinoplanes ovalisporus]
MGRLAVRLPDGTIFFPSNYQILFGELPTVVLDCTTPDQRDLDEWYDEPEPASTGRAAARAAAAQVAADHT